MPSSGGAEEPDPIIVGYEYYIAFHLMFALSGICAVREIWAGDKVNLWRGNANELTSGVTINKPNCFGGKKSGGQGGWKSDVDFMWGKKDADRNPYLPLTGGSLYNCPAYRGRFSMVFRRGTNGAYVGNSGSIENISIVATGSDQSYFDAENKDESWQPDYRWINHGDAEYPSLNAAHIIRDLLLSDDIGMTSNVAEIDDASFSAAALQLFIEEMGLCCFFNEGESTEKMIAEVCRHINAVVRQDHMTGLYQLKLLRDDYDEMAEIGSETFPILFDESNCRKEAYSRIGVGEQVNKIVVSYYDLTTDSNATTFAHDVAMNAMLGGTPIVKEIAYDGFQSRRVATSVAWRDLREQSAPLAKVTLKCNRQASYLRVGDVFLWADQELGISRMVLRVLKISYGTRTDPTIKIDAIEDIFGFGSAVYFGENDDGAVDITSDPERIERRRIVEAPYWFHIFISGALPSSFTDTSGSVLVMAGKQTTTDLSYIIYEKIGIEAYEQASRSGAFAQYGTLVDDVSITDTQISVLFDEEQYIIVGDALYVNNEIMRVDAIDDSNPNFLLLTVGRGCADTIVQSHSLGDVCYDFTGGYGHVSDGYSSGDVVDIKLIPLNTSGSLDEAESPQPHVDSVTIAARHAKPYPPARLRINGEAYPTHVDGSPNSITITWEHRDRELQMGGLHDESEVLYSSAPTGVTYRLRINSGATLLVDTTLAGNVSSYVFDESPSPDFSSLRVRLYAVDGSGRQSAEHDWTFTK